MAQIAPAAYIASWALSVSRVLQVPGISQDLLQLEGVCGTQFRRALNFWDHARHLRGLAPSGLEWQIWADKPEPHLQKLLTKSLDRDNLAM
eukprot:11104569-Karenia_brevis.AAC.1